MRFVRLWERKDALVKPFSLPCIQSKKIMRRYLFLLLLVLGSACNEEEGTITPNEDAPDTTAPPPESRYFPPLSGETWETVSPADLGWSDTKLDELRNYLGAHGTKAFIILKNGRIATEWYLNGFTADSLWYWASAGKTLTTYLIGKAQEDGFLDIQAPTSRYLGEGWTSLSPQQEAQITLWHQLTMTTGLDDEVPNLDCTLPRCLRYRTDPGARWSYHNAPYTLLGNVLEAATGKTRNQLSQEYLFETVGMQGAWMPLEFNRVFVSDARSMARFGLLMLSEGNWDGRTLLQDKAFLEVATTPSQEINPAYGYLWWLNGTSSHMLPRTQIRFTGSLIPSAPDELIAALGKNDQKIYVVPSEELVVIRLGDSAGESKLAASSFDTQLWTYLSALGE